MSRITAQQLLQRIATLPPTERARAARAIYSMARLGRKATGSELSFVSDTIVIVSDKSQIPSTHQALLEHIHQLGLRPLVDRVEFFDGSVIFLSLSNYQRVILSTVDSVEHAARGLKNVAIYLVGITSEDVPDEVMRRAPYGYSPLLFPHPKGDHTWTSRNLNTLKT